MLVGIGGGTQSGGGVDVGERQWGVPSDQQADDRARYSRDRQWLEYAVHEVPAGVLWGANGATPEQCAEMLDGLDEFAGVCGRLGLDDHAAFIDGCRWHFERYPHFLGRRRHFQDYPTYVHHRHGPASVLSPPSPAWFQRW
jgi:hypothetical protein